MTNTEYRLQRYDADAGKCFDWKEPRTHEEKNENGEKVTIVDHLYAKTIFLSVTDSIENYVEIDAPIAE